MKTSIIVTTWSEKSKPYLDACIASIKNLVYRKDLIEVIIVGRKSYKPEYEGCATIAPDSDSFCNEVGLNFGLEHASKDSKYLLICNDDVILTKNSLFNMIQTIGDLPIMANAISNCDNKWKYQLMFGFKKGEGIHLITERYYRYEDFAPFLDDLMNVESMYPSGLLIPPFLCMYATLIPRKVYEILGPFDEKYNGCGPSDLDYCMRADQHNIRYVNILNALIWHFGGATSEKALTQEDRVNNAIYFYKKWRKLPLETTKEMRELIEKKMGKIRDENILCNP